MRHSVTEVTPYDLHVLSTPPAFVLSQNQTLHNIFLEIAGPMNHFSDSSVPCNLAPKFRRTSSRRRPRHASRPFPSLSFFLSGAPPGRLYPVASFSTPLQRLRKSVNLKTASPGLASLALSEPLSLSGCTVSVCRELYTNQPHTSSQFLNKFSLFSHIFCKPLKTQCKIFALFCPKIHFSQKLVDFMQEK